LRVPAKTPFLRRSCWQGMPLPSIKLVSAEVRYPANNSSVETFTGAHSEFELTSRQIARAPHFHPFPSRPHRGRVAVTTILHLDFLPFQSHPQIRPRNPLRRTDNSSVRALNLEEFPMSSHNQFDANRRNSQFSAGLVTGKRTRRGRSRFHWKRGVRPLRQIHGRKPLKPNAKP
jgi:hypothetical protein